MDLHLAVNDALARTDRISERMDAIEKSYKDLTQQVEDGFDRLTKSINTSVESNLDMHEAQFKVNAQLARTVDTLAVHTETLVGMAKWEQAKHMATGRIRQGLKDIVTVSLAMSVIMAAYRYLPELW